MTPADVERLAKRGMHWLIARTPELSPDRAASNWLRSDRAGVATAEAAIGACLAMQLAGMPEEAVGLRDALRVGCLPGLLDAFNRQPPRWFRPLLATAGAFQMMGDPWHEAETTLHAQLAVAMPDPGSLRFDQILEVRFWLRQLNLLPRGTEADLRQIAGQEIIRLAAVLSTAADRIDRDTAYAMTHLVFYGWEFGTLSSDVPAVPGAIERLGTAAAAAGDIDLLAEAVIAARVLDIRLPMVRPAAVRLFHLAQHPSGAIRPSLAIETIEQSAETECCYHSTIVGSVAAGIISRWMICR